MTQVTQGKLEHVNSKKPSRESWSHALVAELIHSFAKHGLDATRERMREEHGTPPERTDAKLAEMGYLALDPDESATVDSFAKFLLAMDSPSRGLAMSRLRAAVKAAK